MSKKLPGVPVLRLAVVPLSGGAVKTVPVIEFFYSPRGLGTARTSLFPTRDALMRHPSVSNAQIVAHLRDVQEATWSPDGKTIAFTRGFRIWLMNSDGTHVRPLTPEPRMPADIRDTRHASSPTWSPDGAQLAYFDETPFRASGSSITIVGSDGSGPHTLVKLGPYPYPHPTWSPDGHQIAFADSRSGKVGIFTVPVDGGSPNPPSRARRSWSPVGLRRSHDQIRRRLRCCAAAGERGRRDGHRGAVRPELLLTSLESSSYA